MPMLNTKLFKPQGFRCMHCQAVFDWGNLLYKCKYCGWPLTIEYEVLEHSSKRFLALIKGAKRLWDFYPILPIDNLHNIVTLGEGGTPLISATTRLTKHRFLYFKLESHNPTGSFKDRPISVIVTFAKENNISCVVAASSGNTGVSVAAYSAAGGLEAHIFLPGSCSPEKIALMQSYGAIVRKVEGTFSDAVRGLQQQKIQCINATTTLVNPLGLEGNKTIAYELAGALSKIDYIFIPIGAGPLLVGLYKGFNDLVKFGINTQVPHLVGVQPEGCAPIAEAFSLGLDHVEPWTKPVLTCAEGIADPLVGYEDDGTIALRCVRETEGFIVTVTDEEILSAMRALARFAGVLAEPAGAASFAGFLKVQEKVPRDSRVVCIITGSGLKGGWKWLN